MADFQPVILVERFPGNRADWGWDGRAGEDSQKNRLPYCSRPTLLRTWALTLQLTMQMSFGTQQMIRTHGWGNIELFADGAMLPAHGVTQENRAFDLGKAAEQFTDKNLGFDGGGATLYGGAGDFDQFERVTAEIGLFLEEAAMFARGGEQGFGGVVENVANFAVEGSFSDSFGAPNDGGNVGIRVVDGAQDGCAHLGAEFGRKGSAAAVH